MMVRMRWVRQMMLMMGLKRDTRFTRDQMLIHAKAVRLKRLDGWIRRPEVGIGYDVLLSRKTQLMR